MIVALCGGVGGSKLVSGLAQVLPLGDLTVIVNTADDLEFCGLHVSPDLDTVMYTLADLAGPMGWGMRDDTFAALGMLQRFGVPIWFQIGDRDLATHVYRTATLRSGETLTAVTADMCARLGVRSRILPMTDARVATRLYVEGEWVEFQEYFVHRRHAVPVERIRYEGIESSEATREVRNALEEAETIIIVNSNPVLSILPILAVPDINDLLLASTAPTVAVTPIVGQGAVSGPAGDLMRLIGQPPTAIGVAGAYLGVIDGIVIDEKDAEAAPSIEALGMYVRCTDTIMPDAAGRKRVATEALSLARELQ